MEQIPRQGKKEAFGEGGAISALTGIKEGLPVSKQFSSGKLEEERMREGSEAGVKKRWEKRDSRGKKRTGVNELKASKG